MMVVTSAHNGQVLRVWEMGDGELGVLLVSHGFNGDVAVSLSYLCIG